MMYDDDLIIKMYKDGFCVGDIIKRIGCSMVYARRTINHHNTINEDFSEKIIDMASENHSVKRISCVINVAQEKIEIVINDNKNRIYSARLMKKRKVLAEYNKGIPYLKIAKNLGFFYDFVTWCIKSTKEKKLKEIEKHERPKRIVSSYGFSIEANEAILKLVKNGHEIETIKNNYGAVWLDDKIVGVGDLCKIANKDSPRLVNAVFGE
jgi:hypothetical protein